MDACIGHWLLEVMFSLKGGVWYIEMELVYINCSQRVLDAIIYIFSIKCGSIHFNIYGLTEVKVRSRPWDFYLK